MDETRLLLVEDDPAARMMFDARLRRAGFIVTAVASAEQALDLLRAGRFALLITGLNLQHLDGVALMDEARTLDPDLEVIITHLLLTMPHNLPLTHAILRVARGGKLKVISWNHDSPFFA
ncbi:MAG: response regulator, partial [Chloroflexales bacterium]|nr:response regulator [Chloroflexales bacterium]